MSTDLKLTHPLVRSLAWLIGSPGLLVAPADAAEDALVSDDWCRQALADSRGLLLALDDQPAELEAAIAACTSRRLGRIAECLIAFWLEKSERFELLAQNLAVRDAGRTLGEYDLVFVDHQEKQVIHWEMAVKFYLRRRGGTEFLGPEGRDTLARKARRVFDHQLCLGASPAGRAALAALCSGQVVSRAFVKGWLFHPDDGRLDVPQVSPFHQRGWWRTLEEFATTPENLGRRFSLVERADWMNGPLEAAARETASAAVTAQRIEARFAADARALMVAGFESPGGKGPESGRGFVVPEQWPSDPAGT